MVANETPLQHGRLLHELEMLAESADRVHFLRVVSSNTTRWEQRVTPRTPVLTEHLGFTREDEHVQNSFEV